MKDRDPKIRSSPRSPQLPASHFSLLCVFVSSTLLLCDDHEETTSTLFILLRVGESFLSFFFYSYSLKVSIFY